MKRTFILRNPSIKDKAIQAIRECEDGKYRIIIEPHVSKRSLAQNSYLWGVVYERIRYHLAETGLTDEIYGAETLHEYFKQKFLPTQVIEIGKEQKIVTGSTTKLSVVDMRDFIDQIINYAADEYQCYIPPPGEWDE